MNPAIILLGHGSRAPGAAEAMERVATGVAARHPGHSVRIAHMELCEPDLATTVAACVAAGAQEILVVPYFLHLGNHLREDIPGLLAIEASRHPSVAIRCGPPFGYDEVLVELVGRRIADARIAPLVTA